MTKRSFGHIRKLPSGKHQASFTSPGGKRVNAPYTFLTRGDASAWLAGEEVRIRSGAWSPPVSLEPETPSGFRFENFVERHICLQTNSDGSLLRESTKNLYRRLLRVNLSKFHGVSMESITSAQISEWWADSISSGKKTIASKAYKLLSASMNRAVGEKVIPSNPCMVRGAQSAKTGKRISVPTVEEVALIAKNINPRYSKLVLLMAFGGFRFGEATELRRGDVRLIELGGRPTYEFSVERAVTWVGTELGKGEHVVSRPKSRASVRKVVISPLLRKLIDDILTGCDSDQSLLFPAATSETNHLRHDVFMNSWRPALLKSGIQAGKYSPHCLRHFAGSQLHLAGANIAELKEWLGDSSTSAVMRYVHTTGRTAAIAAMLAPDAEAHLAA